MTHFLTAALSFPAVVYTVVLGVVLVYWVFVMIGAAHVNLLGEGAADGALDGAADGALDGAAKGALEGATKGILEGAADHAGGAEGHDLGDVPDGGAIGIMAALKLRSAPATVVLSLIVLFAWLLSMLGMQAVTGLGLDGGALTAAKLAVFVVAPLVALLPTSALVRPLARVFTPHAAPRHASLVGKLCTIRTGTVTDRFGEALLEDGGAGVVVRVRVESGERLGRGDQAVIVGYDAERQEFTVAPMEGLLEERDAADEGEAASRRAGK
jgi:hypothetical protein